MRNFNLRRPFALGRQTTRAIISICCRQRICSEFRGIMACFIPSTRKDKHAQPTMWYLQFDYSEFQIDLRSALTSLTAHTHSVTSAEILARGGCTARPAGLRVFCPVRKPRICRPRSIALAAKNGQWRAAAAAAELLGHKAPARGKWDQISTGGSDEEESMARGGICIL